MEQSGQAAGEISVLIMQIQNESMKAVEAMNEGKVSVQEGVQKVHQTGDAFEEIAQIIEEISSNTLEVSSVIEQTNKGTRGMVEMMQCRK